MHSLKKNETFILAILKNENMLKVSQLNVFI